MSTKTPTPKDILESTALVPTSPSALVATPSCPICAHPRRAEIDKALSQPKVKLSAIADQFETWTAQLKRHLPHLAEGALILAQSEPLEMLRARVKGRSSVLFRAASLAISKGESLEKAAKLADVAFKYDQMLAKLMQAPGFKGGNTDDAPSINAPGSQFVIQSGLGSGASNSHPKADTQELARSL